MIRHVTLVDHHLSDRGALILPQPDDSAYYLLRASEELERANHAASPASAAVHKDLALRYGVLASQSENENAVFAPGIKPEVKVPLEACEPNAGTSLGESQ